MKRIGNLYDKVVSLSNCILAAENAVRYKKKRNRVGTLSFDISINPQYYGYMVYQLLKSGNFIPSKPDHFVIEEGIKKKKREIYAPKLFPDQIVHWAIIQVIAPPLLKSFYYYSCGSLPRRGPNLVKKYLEKELAVDNKHYKHLRSIYKYCLKLDIHHFFQSINIDIMMDIISSKFKDKKLLTLIESIIRAEDKGPGLPIGYYTSQWLANLYLDKFDHWIKRRLSEEFGHNIYIRYVDDLVIVASNKRKLRRILDEIKEYLRDNLNLSLKYDTYDQIFDICKRPIDFVGFKFTYGKTTVRNSIFHNAINAEKDLNKHDYTFERLASVISYNGWINASKCYNEKNRLYKFPDNFYKSKFKKAHRDPKLIRKLNKARELSLFKNRIRRYNRDNLANLGEITLMEVIKLEDGHYAAIEQHREIVDYMN